MTDPQPYVERLLDDESLAGDLDDAPREKLVAWLTARAEAAVAAAKSEAEADAAVAALRKEGRALAKKLAADPTLELPATRRETR